MPIYKVININLINLDTFTLYFIISVSIYLQLIYQQVFYKPMFIGSYHQLVSLWLNPKLYLFRCLEIYQLIIFLENKLNCHLLRFLLNHYFACLYVEVSLLLRYYFLLINYVLYNYRKLSLSYLIILIHRKYHFLNPSPLEAELLFKLFFSPLVVIK